MPLAAGKNKEINQAILWLSLFSYIEIFLPNCSSNSAVCKLLNHAPINLKPMPVTTSLLEVFEEVHYDFTISEAPNQINHKPKTIS